MSSRYRFVAAVLLAGSVLAPPTMTVPATAAANPVVWTLSQRTFDPARGRDTITTGFTAQSPYYLVEVTLSSSEPGDEAYVQLGDDDHDFTKVQSGEDRFFVATHLKVGSRPAFRLIADPRHAYGGRALTYAAQVMRLPDLPITADGSATSTVPNSLAFNVRHPGIYTVHYQLDTGSARIVVYSATATKDSGKVTGEGSFTVALPAGAAALALRQDPGGYPMHWSLAIGIAPTARDFQPATGATLTAPPATISVIASPGAQILLDHQLVGSRYLASSGRLVYEPAQPLPAGVHEVDVRGADGTPATARSEFEILPAASQQPPAAPVSASYGVSWVRTTTPDGRYTLLKPASWLMASSGGAVTLAEPHGKQFIVLSERFLNTAVSAIAIAQRLEQALAAKMEVDGAPRYGGADSRAGVFTMVKSSNGAAWANVDLVLPNPDHYELLLGLGFDTTASSDGVNIVARIETSVAPNDEAGVLAARRWQHFSEAGLSLDYPEGWAADFASTAGIWFAGPADQAIMFASGLTYSGSGADMQVADFGHQITARIQAKLHPDLKIVNEQNGNGIYRWLATFSIGNQKSVGVEYGQAVLANGSVQAIWGDTDLEQLPGNLPLFGHVLDSAARDAGLTPPTAFDVAGAVHAMGADVPPAATQGESTSSATPGSSGAYVRAYQGLVARGNDYTSMSNMMMMNYAAGMNIAANIGDSGAYYEVTDAY